MCGICGCDNHIHEHAHEHTHTHNEHDRVIKLEQDILAENNNYAQLNRHYFSEHNILALNFVSSPGSGKTTLLEKTILALKDKYLITVIEGDQQTSRDADRIALTGVPVLQINTGKACHLDAHQIGHAIEKLRPPKDSLLFIENVGNLVCPALFDLGEAHKIVMLSVTEGDDKPLKYPEMFHEATLMLINKIDLLPYVEFSLQQCVEYARRINPGLEVIEISATKNNGMTAWLQWLHKHDNVLQ